MDATGPSPAWGSSLSAEPSLNYTGRRVVALSGGVLAARVLLGLDRSCVHALGENVVLGSTLRSAVAGRDRSGTGRIEVRRV